MDFKFNPTQIAPQSPVRVDTDSTKVSHVFASEYDETCQQAMMARVERPGLSSIGMLIMVPKFMTGGAGKFVSETEWQSEKHGTFDLAVEIENRIKELGLNPQHVREHFERRVGFAAYQQFNRLPFLEQMEILK